MTIFFRSFAFWSYLKKWNWINCFPFFRSLPRPVIFSGSQTSNYTREVIIETIREDQAECSVSGNSSNRRWAKKKAKVATMRKMRKIKSPVRTIIIVRLPPLRTPPERNGSDLTGLRCIIFSDRRDFHACRRAAEVL